MPDELLLIIGGVVLALLLLAIAGAFVLLRRRSSKKEFHGKVLSVDHQLASAYADDQGWSREILDSSASTIFTEEVTGSKIFSIDLQRIIDRPGISEDFAVFDVDSDSGRYELALTRKDERGWVLHTLERLR